MTLLLEVRHLSKNFSAASTTIAAVKDVSFAINAGECVGLVGSSGCGKSTLARLLMGITASDSGRITFEQQVIDCSQTSTRKNYYQKVQLIFQNAVAAFHPRKSIGTSILLPMLHYGYNNKTAQARLPALLADVGLTMQHANKFPHQLSGGECQRAAIARAISVSPQLLICDEITSALDLPVQDEIINLLLKLQTNTRMGLLFISHDIVLVQEICQRIMVMQAGTIIESGATRTVITAPQQKYTQALINAAISINKEIIGAAHDQLI